MTKEEQRFTAAVAAMQGMLSNPEIMRAKLDFFKYQTIDNCIKMSIQYADALMKELDNKVDYKEIPERPYVEDLLDSHIKKTTPDPITQPSMNAIGDIKLRK